MTDTPEGRGELVALAHRIVEEAPLPRTRWRLRATLADGVTVLAAWHQQELVETGQAGVVGTERLDWVQAAAPHLTEENHNDDPDHPYVYGTRRWEYGFDLSDPDQVLDALVTVVARARLDQALHEREREAEQRARAEAHADSLALLRAEADRVASSYARPDRTGLLEAFAARRYAVRRVRTLEPCPLTVEQIAEVAGMTVEEVRQQQPLVLTMTSPARTSLRNDGHITDEVTAESLWGEIL
ncbi:hypothetical protein GCM10022243_48810 [Saccharothrix violaceirubra]|uniref:Uncharacterized protein n=1 Tax=Saccharothrix violaceirubra TaxID=413306 RepID=A0A7W7T0I7_9PSEU|nr:hypothetical protein [Saccharothrix violaceirubra]MBB4963777.1 hypothetical protein [Saccharothrix violaceirubra]